MRYLSTRDKNAAVSAQEAIVRGLSAEGGLFTPEELPKFTLEEIKGLAAMDYPERAEYIMKPFLPDFTDGELLDHAQKAYSGFEGGSPAPVVSVGSIYMLELWHGPTAAFKDMALQIMPRLLVSSLEKTGEKRQACILVATSGDTGKAALEGYADVPGLDIFVFYPKDGVSDIQRLQMTTQEGANVGVCAVEGNFDDAQSGVKAIFSDEGLKTKLNEAGRFFSSANSINWGRLLPQIVYYFSAYADLCGSDRIKAGEKVNFCVPTGNFGNILSAWFAREMGLPVKKLICASNANNVLTDFINTGVYDRNREFFTTISPSMDILISSNLERLLFYASGMDDVKVRDIMAELSSSGKYDAGEEITAKIHEVFEAGYCNDTEAMESIKYIFAKTGYLMDPHTAVGCNVYDAYRRNSGDNSPSIIVSTASPYKFCGSVLTALKGNCGNMDAPALIKRLEELSGIPAPANLAALAGKTERFGGVAAKDEMVDAVMEFLRI